jgi:hypothetical protein
VYVSSIVLLSYIVYIFLKLQIFKGFLYPTVGIRKKWFTGDSPQTIHRRAIHRRRFTARAIHRRLIYWRGDSPRGDSPQAYSPQAIQRKNKLRLGRFTANNLPQANPLEGDSSQTIHRKKNTTRAIHRKQLTAGQFTSKIIAMVIPQNKNPHWSTHRETRLQQTTSIRRNSPQCSENM